MESSSKNRSLYIDKEAISSLALAKEGLLAPVYELMGQKEAKEVDEKKEINGVSFPFSFLLAPSGKKNQDILKSAKKGETLDLVNEHKKYGEIKVDEVFEIDPIARVQNIFGSKDMNHPGIVDTLKRLGSYAVAGKYTIAFPQIRDTKVIIKEVAKQNDAKEISAVMIAAKPLHRGHERMIRQTLDRSDLVVVFLLKPYKKDILSYEVRHKTLKYLVDNFLPSNKVVIVPLENTYLFAGNNEMILDAIVAQNFGCTRLVTGLNHIGLGIFYEKDKVHSIFDTIKGIDIEIDLLHEFVYCNECRTLVSTKTCPHGHHHHINYHSDTIMELLKAGIMPPAVLMRKEISAILLKEMFPGRFKNLGKIFYDIFPAQGLLEDRNEEEFYLELMNLYQTTSLT